MKEQLAAVSDLIERSKFLVALISAGDGLLNPTKVSVTYDIPPSTASVFLKNLEKHGILERVSGIDGRRVYYILTDQGKDVLEGARKILRKELEKRCVEEFTGDKYVLGEECLKEFLKRFNNSAEIIRWLGVRKITYNYRKVPILEVGKE